MAETPAGEAGAPRQADSPRPASPPAADDECRAPARWPAPKVLWLSFAAAMVLFVLYSAYFRTQWVFSVQARTHVVEVVTPENRETKWRINNAVICSRTALDLKPAHASLLPLPPGTCGNRWKAYQATDPEQTLILKGRYHVVLESRHDQSLFIALRQQPPPPEPGPAAHKGDGMPALKQGAWLSFSGDVPDVDLAASGKLRINIVFPPTADADSDRVFPFSGDTTIGRDINWTGTSMLTEGSIQVYTADASPDKRMLVEETALLLGDQLRLDPVLRDGKVHFPKGFVRYSPARPAFDVIAFGAADRVRIERYGDNGYSFKPGKLSLLLHNQWFIQVTTTLLALITLFTTLAAVYAARERR